MSKESQFNSDLYAEMLKDEGCQYDPELYSEVANYYLQNN